MSFDNTCKFLSANNPESFVNWLLGETPASIQLLNTELNIDTIRADFVALLPEQKRLLHIEFQVVGETDPPLPLRMLDYWVRLHRIYRLPISQFLVLLKQSRSATEVPSEFALEGTLHHYQIIRLWEQNPEPFLQDSALLPLASLCATSNSTELLRQVVTEIDKIKEPEQRQIIANCTQVLAGLRFPKNIIRQFFSEEIMRESVIYQEIFQEGHTEGRAEGRAEGLKTEALSMVIRQMTRRIGGLSPELAQQIQQLSLNQLENLGEALLDFSQPGDLVAWLAANQAS